MTHLKHTTHAQEDGFAKNPDTLVAQEQLDAEKDRYIQEGNLFLKNNAYLFTDFAKSTNVQFVLSNGFFIDLEKKIVHLDTSWFYDKGCTKEQILWAVLHELTHFRDLVEDEKGLMDTFSYMRNQAERTGLWIIEQYKKHFPEHPEYIDHLLKRDKNNQSTAGKMMYDEHHTFFNIFDDIFVNTEIPRRAASYEQEGTWGSQVRDLYAKKLFATTDYTTVSRHRQFVYALLRKVMVPDEQVQVSVQVQKLLDTPIVYLGKKYTPMDIVKTFVIPRIKKDTKAGTRSMVLKHTLEKIYMDLLKKDIEEWVPEPPKNSSQTPNDQGENTDSQNTSEKNDFGTPFQKEHDDFSQHSPDQISPEDFDKLKDKIKKEWEEQAKKEEDDARSNEEKEQEAADARAKHFQNTYNVSQKEYDDYLEIFQEVAPYINDLAELWEYLISKAGGNILRTERLRPEGHSLSIPAVISAFPQIATKNFDGLRIMKKHSKEFLPANKPEDIRLRVIGDVSGSMDSTKLTMLKRCIVLLLTSFAQFQYKLDMTRATTKSDLNVDTEAWIYSSQATKVKSFNPDHSYQKAQADVMHILSQIESDGSTANDTVYKEVLRNYTDSEKQHIKEGKRMDICIELTDGKPDDPAVTQKLTTVLRDMGVIVKAFQIGKVSESERATFDEVWNPSEHEVHGVCIGSDLAQTLPALVQLLEAYLEGIRL